MNNKGADQTRRMRRLVCAFVVRKPPKTGFFTALPIYQLMDDAGKETKDDVEEIVRE